MAENYIEVGEIIVNGAKTFSVRLFENGKLVKALQHCNTLDQADAIAKTESEARQIELRYGGAFPPNR